jgi:pSer/pThr/pTyr-binding forkhead associated (FHA) protein
MAYLQLTAGPNPGEKHDLSEETTRLGRHPLSDVVVTHPAVQRQHALILQIDGDFYLDDCNSRTGTYVNGRLVSARVKLEDGDVISIADAEVGVFHS